jgi:hypothetical protein
MLRAEELKKARRLKWKQFQKNRKKIKNESK